MMKIHEVTKADGSLAPISLGVEDGVLELVADGESFPLPEGALEAVMARFGKVLEPSVRLTEVETLELGEGRRLRHVRHLALYDVIALDWLVYEAIDREPLCALATTAAGALAHLGRAAARTP